MPRLLRNIAANYVGAAVQVVVLFLLTPYVLHKLGTTFYGVWVLAHSATFYLRFLDLGLYQTVVKYTADHTALGRRDRLDRLLSTTGTSLLLAGLTALILSILIAAFLAPRAFQVTDDVLWTLQIVIVLLGIDLLVSFPGSVFDAVLEGRQRYDILNLTGSAFAIAGALATFLLLHQGFGIVALAVLEVASAVAGFIVDYVIVRRVLPSLSFRPGLCRKETWIRIRGYALWTSANDILAEGSSQLDKLLVAGLLSVSLVTPYSLGTLLAAVMFMLIEPMGEVFFPVAAHQQAEGDQEAIRRLLIRGTKASMFLAVPSGIVIAVWGQQILDLWVGEEYAALPVGFLSVLVISFLISIFFYSGSTILEAIGRLKQLFWLSLVEGILAILLVVLAAERYGLLGVVGGFAVANLVVTLGFAVPYLCSVLSLPRRTYAMECLVKPLLAAVPAGLAAWWLAGRFAASWPAVIAQGAAVGLVYAAGFLFTSISPAERLLMRRGGMLILDRLNRNRRAASRSQSGD